MRGVQLDHVEAGVDGHAGGGDEFIANAVHVGAGHRPRHLVERRPRHVARGHHRPIAVIEGDVIALPAQFGRTLAARMAELEADLRRGLRVGEIDDPLPCREVIGVPHAGAAGTDPSLGRDAGHFGEQQPGAADRSFAIMDEVEVVGHAVDRRIHRHRRDGDAVHRPPSRAALRARTSAARPCSTGRRSRASRTSVRTPSSHSRSRRRRFSWLMRWLRVSSE